MRKHLQSTENIEFIAVTIKQSADQKNAIISCDEKWYRDCTALLYLLWRKD